MLSDSDTIGFGECAPLPGLSVDARPDFSQKLGAVCDYINKGGQPDSPDLSVWPAINFGLETALLDLRGGGDQMLFDTPFRRGQGGLATNGLVVMGDRDAMLNQAREKVEAGFTCIKIKIGALDFNAECELLSEFRQLCSAQEIELRLDANGAFSEAEALDKLHELASFEVHSLEQPIKAGNWQGMAEVCQNSPIPIALDEELIGVSSADKTPLLQTIRPQYIILKPSLLGGFKLAREWIESADRLNIGYWVTSALESNIGLNAISQWTATLALETHQGLGTGKLFVRNFPSSLQINRGVLFYEQGQNKSPKQLNDLGLE